MRKVWHVKKILVETKMNILFTCAGRRAYLLRYFRVELDKFSPGSRIFATDMQLNAPALAFADEKIQVPSVYAEDYLAITVDICKSRGIDLLISLNDLELPLLSNNKAVFEEVGTKVLVSSPEVIETCFDKYRTALFVESVGLRSPRTFVDYGEVLQAIEEGVLRFPVVLKPRWGSGSIGIEFVETMEELEEMYSLLLGKVKRSILGTVSGTKNYILFQEKIVGAEFGLDIMNDLEGRFRAVSVKRKLAMRAGETDKAVTEANPQLEGIGKHIGENLRHIGNLDCDILEQDGRYYVLELNPRFGGGYPFSHEAGVNMPGAIIRWCLGGDVDRVSLRSREGEMFAKCDTLVRVN